MINRVLIVNDSHMERKMAGELLKANFAVFEAASGQEAHRFLETQEVDLIVLDNVMKDETGYIVAKELRLLKQFDNIPLILLSSNENPLNELEAFESGFNAYLNKSDIEERLQDLVESFNKKQLERSVRVLVVDDSRMIRAMLSCTFMKEGFTVKTANSGEEAIEILKNFKPSFITMDVEMGGIDGFQTSSMIRNNSELKDIPIIMISSLDTVESTVKAFESGIVEYFLKPFEPIKIINYIKDIIIRLNQPSSERILVYAKSHSNQHILKYLLSKNGYKIHVAEYVDDIWHWIKQENINLILFDFDEGDLTPGFHLCKEIKQILKQLNLDIPLIVVTSILNKYAIIEAFRNGADDYISKPFNLQELLIRVRTHLTAHSR